jgi:hypothetical protein
MEGFCLVAFMEKRAHNQFPGVGIGENQLLRDDIVENE